MKSGRIRIFLLALMLAGMVTAVVSAAEAVQQDISLISTAPASMKDPADRAGRSIGRYAFPGNDRQEIFRAIDESTLTHREKADLKRKLNAIWSGTSGLSDDEVQAVFVQIYSLVMNTGGPSVEWTGYPTDPYYQDVHNDMAWIAGYSMGLGQSAANTLKSWAGQPDVPAPGASWNHYYSSGAADQAASYATKSRTGWRSNPSQALIDLAYSMHFMADMSDPFHYWFAQGLPQHAAYESFVGNKWHSSDLNFYSSVASDGYYYYITNVRDSASYLAWKSHYYQNRYDYINNKILSSPTWQTDPTLIQYTRQCLIDGERYQMGLVDFVRR